MLIVFRRKCVKPESQATAKHKWHKLTFDPNTKSLPDFLEDFNECADRAFGDNPQHMIDSLLYAKLPPHMKRSLNLAYLENGTYDQKVAHLEKELEFSGLENDGEPTIPTMTAVPPNDNQQNTEQTKIVITLCLLRVRMNDSVVQTVQRNLDQFNLNFLPQKITMNNRSIVTQR